MPFARIAITNDHRNDGRTAGVQTLIVIGNMDSETRRAKLNEAFLAGRSLGRKFTPSDITAALRVSAEVFAHQYEGTFEYMVSMKQALTQWGTLTDAQASGTLNCLMAEARRRQQARRANETATPEAPAATPVAEAVCAVRDGYYTVQFADGTHRTLRVQTLTDEEIRRYNQPSNPNFRPMNLTANAQHVSLLIGADNTSDYARMGIMDGGAMVKRWGTVRTYQGREATGEQLSRAMEAVRTLFSADDETRTAYGTAYARVSGNCWVCGRVLTTPESIAAGIGPVCAGRQ